MRHLRTPILLLAFALLSPTLLAQGWVDYTLHKDAGSHGEGDCFDGDSYYAHTTRHGATVRTQSKSATAKVVTFCSAEDDPQFRRADRYVAANVTVQDTYGPDRTTVLVERYEHIYDGSNLYLHYCMMGAHVHHDGYERDLYPGCFVRTPLSPTPSDVLRVIV